jgi:hypothetical protein
MSPIIAPNILHINKRRVTAHLDVSHTFTNKSQKSLQRYSFYIILSYFCSDIYLKLDNTPMIDQIIANNILSPLMGDGYKAGGIKTHPLVPKDVVVRGFIIDSETGELV